MQLFILRHADAEPSATSDAARKLTEKGHAQAERVACFLQEHALTPSLILTSPLRRAEQTALAVSERLKVELAVADWLASGMLPSTAWAEIHAFRQSPSLLLVGHEPDLSGLIAFLLGLPSPTQLNVRKASLTCLELPIWRAGAAQLNFSLPCRLM